MQKRGSRSKVYALALAGFVAATGAAAAEDTIKIAYIDPLSGPGATVGEVGLKTYQFLDSLRTRSMPRAARAVRSSKFCLSIIRRTRRKASFRPKKP